MWKQEGNIFVVEPFPCRIMVTTASCGNMKDGERRRDFCAGRNVDPSRLTLGRQVHGIHVAIVDEANSGREFADTDALITGGSGIPLGIFTADCVPVFVATKDASCGGVIHAGWRGMAAGIIGAAVAKLIDQFAVRASDIMAAVGPHIQPCCYPVSADLLKTFSQAGPALDLGAAAVEQLHKSGVSDIVSCGRCTHHETDLFFSYRRDQTESRLLSVIVL
jgi:YfiH family protein